MRIFSKRRAQGRPPHPDVLTPAEWRVLEQIRAGRTNQEIADHLGVSPNTVKTHVSNMLAKLEVEHRHELAAWRGAPAEASRAALGRMHLAGPLAWAGRHMAGWGGRILAGAGAVAVGVVFLFAMQSLNESPAPGGTDPASTPTAALTEEPTAGTDVFVAAASPAVPRSFHTATLLGDGTVLVAGGCCVGGGADGLVVEAERYDPAADRWSSAGFMAAGRQTHTATRLADGRVVLAGGVGVGDPAVDSNPPLGSIEIYDPDLGEFSLVAQLETPRLAHDAVLMPDGRVLVVAGIGRGDPPRNVEAFDPAAGETATLPVELPPAFDMPRVLLLEDGDVLIVGGGSAGVLDPVSGTLELLPAPEGLDAWPTGAVALRDGRVLVAGSCCDAESSTLPHAAIFDPAARTAHRLPGMTTGRISQTMTLLDDGRVLIVGGLANAGHGFGEQLASVELFDPLTETFVAVAPMPRPRSNHTVTLLLDGSALVVGPDSEPDPGAVRFLPR